MVTIRLARGGSKKRPFYHLTVTDSRTSRDVLLNASVSLTLLLAVMKSVCALILHGLITGFLKARRCLIALRSCSKTYLLPLK
jgi:hypothetical protein